MQNEIEKGGAKGKLKNWCNKQIKRVVQNKNKKVVHN